MAARLIELVCSNCGSRHDAIPSAAKKYKTLLCRKCYDGLRKSTRQKIECPSCGLVRWLSPAQAAQCGRGYCRSCPDVYSPDIPQTYDAGYVVGAVLGDGYLFKKGFRLEVTDKKFAEKFALHAGICLGKPPKLFTRIVNGKAYPKFGIRAGKRTFHIVQYYSAEWYAKLLPLKRNKLYGRLRNYTQDFKIGFVQGLLDSEGYVGPRGGLDIANTDRKLLCVAAKFFRDLKYQHVPKIYGPYPYSRGVMHLQIRGTGLIKTREAA